MAFEALARLFRRDHLEELLLTRGGADGGQQFALGRRRLRLILHGHGRTTTRAPGA